MARHKLAIAFMMWLLIMILFIIELIGYSFPKNRIVLSVLRIVISLCYFIEILILKLEKHRLSLIPIMVDFAMRNFMIHCVFGIFNHKIFSLFIYFCWLFIDMLTFLKEISNKKIVAYAKYYLNLPIYVLHSLIECVSIYLLSIEFSIPTKWMLLLFLFAHIMGISVVIKHKSSQLYWFIKSQKKSRSKQQ